MITRRTTIGIGAVAVFVLLVLLWSQFRPELLFINAAVNEPAPVAMSDAMAKPTAAAMSDAMAKPTEAAMFTSLAHETSGTASITSLDDGSHVLRLEDFKTSNGPDVHVYLVCGTDAAKDDAIVAGKFIDLGSIKGNIGNQNYVIPAGTDLSQYQAVSIWCQRFGINFGGTKLN